MYMCVFVRVCVTRLHPARAWIRGVTLRWRRGGLRLMKSPDPYRDGYWEPPFRRSESPPGTPPRGGARRLVWSRTWFVLNTAAYAFNRSRPLLYTDLAYRCFIKVPHLASSTPTIFSLYHHSSDLYAFIIMKMCNSNYKICIYMPLTL